MAKAKQAKWIENVSPDDPVAEVALRTIENRLTAVQHYLPRAVETDEGDTEAIHQLRVSTRRAVAALKMYADLLPRRRTAWIKKQLKRLRRAAGEARDLDVLIQRLEERIGSSESKPFLDSLRARRQGAEKPLAKLCNRLTRDDRLDRRIDKLLRKVESAGRKEPCAEEARFGDWAVRCIRPLADAFFAAAPTPGTNMSGLHLFRIHGKQLRYAMEMLAGAFSSDLRETLYPIIETLQDKLGQINDLATAQSLLGRCIEESDDSDETDRLKEFLMEDRQRLDELQKEVRDWVSPQFVADFRAKFESMLGAAVVTAFRRTSEAC